VPEVVGRYHSDIAGFIADVDRNEPWHVRKGDKVGNVPYILVW